MKSKASLSRGRCGTGLFYRRFYRDGCADMGERRGRRENYRQRSFAMKKTHLLTLAAALSIGAAFPASAAFDNIGSVVMGPEDRTVIYRAAQ
jgi:hypothetical protein